MPYKKRESYALSVGCLAGISPADGEVDYFGSLTRTALTSATFTKIPIPLKGRVTRCILMWCDTGAASTNENIVIAIRKNNTTDYVFSTVGNTSHEKTFANYALDIPVDAGDYLEFKMTCPTWATNPTGVYFSGSISIEY